MFDFSIIHACAVDYSIVILLAKFTVIRVLVKIVQERQKAEIISLPTHNIPLFHNMPQVAVHALWEQRCAP